MRPINTLTLVALCLPSALAACGTCNSTCGFYCNNGCDASLDYTECSRCLYCRRESSSCGYIDIGDTWTQDPPTDELCAACTAGCWCHGDWYCMDNATGPPPPSPPTKTRSVVLPTKF
ncbi:hypothetical protein F4821DRAFT_258192 [Hypoxylon rubiginosum]|uniref:Uncharacterized protein n=1 Tax=Hypoxylon rubiginosum TaxID=110542 RepID=A0ACC0D7L0_9PEZI|nr:hypothetical protein F4821DRAFT_258192 [Hypoxylon rubiginosum]